MSESTNFRLTKQRDWYCVEERCEEPNPKDIWHIVVRWSRDREGVEAELKRLQDQEKLNEN